MKDKSTTNFLNLPRPNKEGIYNVINIPNSKHKLGKNKNGYPALLIAVNSKNDDFISDIKLKYLSVLFNVSCKLSHKGRVTEGSYVIVENTSEDSELVYPFLSIAHLIIKLLGNSPKSKDVRLAIAKFVNLFRCLVLPPKKSIQGLWAELFVISNSKNPKKMLQAWHNLAEEKYDFNYENCRIEVKSNASRERVHNFLYEQLTPPASINLIIASVFAEINSSGKNIEEMANQISKKIGSDKALNEKLISVIIATLGNAYQDAKDLKFDTNLAEDSIKYYDYSDIPTICKKHNPIEVSNIKFKSDLSAIKEIIKKDLSRRGKIFQFL